MVYKSTLRINPNVSKRYTNNKIKNKLHSWHRHCQNVLEMIKYWKIVHNTDIEKERKWTVTTSEVKSAKLHIPHLKRQWGNMKNNFILIILTT
jgi:hypothetical protein